MFCRPYARERAVQGNIHKRCRANGASSRSDNGLFWSFRRYRLAAAASYMGTLPLHQAGAARTRARSRCQQHHWGGASQGQHVPICKQLMREWTGQEVLLYEAVGIILQRLPGLRYGGRSGTCTAGSQMVDQHCTAVCRRAYAGRGTCAEFTTGLNAECGRSAAVMPQHHDRQHMVGFSPGAPSAACAQVGATAYHR